MIHIYSGEGKGKTTAAMGLAVRAAGAGMIVGIFQFLKNGSSSEIRVLSQLDGISVRCCKSCTKFTFNMNEEELGRVTAEHNEMLREIGEQRYDVVILDEFFGAYNSGLMDRSIADETVKSFPDSRELILTGRSPSEFFCGLADYHSDIKAVKHPYERGISARKGIEY